ncbi:tRNA dihydrouridine synthase [Pontiella agarivorans]|uniref:tRNA-dihydrouridine synthase n=1 Tax=Pontiella agarivorans TaxID=3038953 RepID=A0ABU5MTL5_9BACT|nr:tRNA-dihydrouridine synthase family protein [Pontiella agarivorans]MDZ8117463.1 tRNA-dihydrouridine synthase family protein [Pontiella agarivorans]
MPSSSPTLILAPMRGITTMHYRRAFVRHFQGLDIEMAPFIPTVSAERINPKLLKDVLPENQSGLPMIPQVIGNNADDFVQMNIALADLGYTEVNWNLGCPHKPIRKKRRGSGLLPFPDTVDQILNEVCERSPVKISVKVRLGVSDKSELIKLIPVLNQFPLSEVIIHPRTAEQMYEGHVDLNAFDEAFQALEHTVCYNGDINDPAFFQTLEKRFPTIQRFMLGRGLLANPFLCEQIKQSSISHIAMYEKPIPRIRAFHDDLVDQYEAVLHGDHPVLGKMKEFWTYQATHLSNGRKMFKKLKKAQKLSTYKAIVAEFLADAEWQA